jgi:4-hydroxy-3-methylbut-2-enyl diphosphate reductase
MKVILAQPRGFCAGVVRAIEIVERALEKFGPPVYVRHEIVHNRHVVESLKAKGARFVEDLSEVPSGAVTIFSAHGVSRAEEDEAEARGLSVLDAICPLVARVHQWKTRSRVFGSNARIRNTYGHSDCSWNDDRGERDDHVRALLCDLTGAASRRSERPSK